MSVCVCSCLCVGLLVGVSVHPWLCVGVNPDTLVHGERVCTAPDVLEDY